MSSDQTQQTIVPDPPKPHLTSVPPRATRNRIDYDRMWYCECCGNRITLSPCGEREYGHAVRRAPYVESDACPHSIATEVEG